MVGDAYVHYTTDVALVVGVICVVVVMSMSYTAASVRAMKRLVNGDGYCYQCLKTGHHLIGCDDVDGALEAFADALDACARQAERRPLCSCHSGSVCSDACGEGKHHAGCPADAAPLTPERPSMLISALQPLSADLARLREEHDALKAIIEQRQPLKFSKQETDHPRLFDMVRYCRGRLLDEGLITALEYVDLVSGRDGAAAARRLEKYDALRAENDRLRALLPPAPSAA